MPSREKPSASVAMIMPSRKRAAASGSARRTTPGAVALMVSRPCSGPIRNGRGSDVRPRREADGGRAVAACVGIDRVLQSPAAADLVRLERAPCRIPLIAPREPGRAKRGTQSSGRGGRGARLPADERERGQPLPRPVGRLRAVENPLRVHHARRIRGRRRAGAAIIQ